jgi:hypothetical protein
MYTEEILRGSGGFQFSAELCARHEDARLHCPYLAECRCVFMASSTERTYELALRGVAAARKTGSQTAAIADSMLGAACCLF